MSLADDFMADAGPQAKAAPSGSLADQFIQDAAVAPSANTKSQTGASGSWANPVDTVARQVGLTARAGVTGLAGIPMMVGDGLNSAINLGTGTVNSLFGTHIPSLQMPSAMLQQGMNAVGVPQPQNATERVVQDATSAIAGVPGFVGAGGVLARNASPLLQTVGKAFTLLPGMQMVGAAGAGAGGGVARENGAGPVGQILAGIAGGAAGAVAPSAALSLGRGFGNTAGNLADIGRVWTNPQAYVGRGVANSLGPSDSAIAAANIRNAQEFVPGSAPTTAQAAGTAGLIATEKAQANRSVDFTKALATREAENNSARWSALNGIAGSPQDMTDAIAVRNANKASAVDSILNNGSPVDATGILKSLDDLVQSPLGMRPTIAAAAKNIASDITERALPTTDGSVLVPPGVLDAARQNIGDYLAKHSPPNRPVGTQQQIAFNPVKAAITDSIESANPGYTSYLAQYAKDSQPISTMSAAQQIADALKTNSPDVYRQPLITKNSFQTKTAQALKAQPYGIAPDAQAQLDAISADLRQAQTSSALKKPGSDTGYNLRANGWLGSQLYGESFGGASGLGRGLGALGATLSGHPYVGLGLLAQGNKLGLMAGDRLGGALGGLLMNPQEMLPYLDAAVKKGVKPLSPSLRNNVGAGLLGMSEATRP